MFDRINQYLKSLLFAIISIILLERFIFGITIVQGISMNPTIDDDDKLIVNKFIYLLEKPKHRDIVVFHPPIEERKRELFIKRVVAMEGDHFFISNGKLYINGSQIAESYIDTRNYLDRHYNYTMGKVPKGTIFVLGDNRNDSNDSRCFGFVPLANIEGKADFRLWPLETLKAFALDYP